MTSRWMVVVLMLWVGACSKAEGEACEEQSDCEEQLACEEVDGKSLCVRCQTWAGCRERGECTDSQIEQGCWAQRAVSCKQSAICQRRGACILAPDYRCVSEEDLRKERQARGEKVDDKPGGVGCPCGCDRSERMAAELEESGGDAAVARIDQTLRTIREREAAGYITEAMVRHRLRMLGLRAKLRGDGLGTARGSSFPARVARSAGRELSEVENATLRVQHELLAHGQIREVVHGREKHQRACFTWRLHIENLGAESLTLDRPTIDATVPFPVSRWYLDGGDGAPWDGRLEPGAVATVLVIGYLGEPIEPGTELAASMKLQALTLQDHARATRRWDEAVRPPDRRTP